MVERAPLRRLLVPLDGSSFAEQTIPYAAAIASGGVEIVFFQVVLQPEPERDLLGRTEVPADEVGRREAERSRAYLREAALRWAAILPREPLIEVAIGDPAAEISRAVGRLSCDFAAMSTRARGAIGRLVLGSVANELARKATVPVLFVRPRDVEAEIALARFDRVLVPYDGSPLAESAFPVAAELARRLRAAVHLVQVVNVTTYTAVPTMMEPYTAPAVYEAVLDEAQAAAKASLERAAATFEAAGLAVSHEAVVGVPAETIADLARDDDLIVMTSHGRSGLQRLLLGSVAETLVREGPVPVVLVPIAGRERAEGSPDLGGDG